MKPSRHSPATPGLPARRICLVLLLAASAAIAETPREGMVLIPAGAFEMGSEDDGLIGASPVRSVHVDAFHMDRFEVSKVLWQSVQKWGAQRGYSIRAGSYQGDGHPVHTITWFDAAKWCNARSEKEGLTPCYYTDESHTTVFRTGNVKITHAQVKWEADGYRLPTEAEWEKAARGGLRGALYPWSDTIDGGQANYLDSGDPFEASSRPRTTPVGYYNGTQTPAGPDMANGYGLYDMAGNLWEWCWDWRDNHYYRAPDANHNPRGPLDGTRRILRGGCWDDPPLVLNVAFRGEYTPSNFDHLLGLRCVRK